MIHLITPLWWLCKGVYIFIMLCRVAFMYRTVFVGNAILNADKNYDEG